jgi:hypothetical protein
MDKPALPPLPPGVRLGMIDQGDDAPLFTEDNVPCLRGPCRHYFTLKQHLENSNAAGTFEPGKGPKIRYHFCRAMPGHVIEFGADDPILECDPRVGGMWSPKTQAELSEQEHRINMYYSRKTTEDDSGN